MLTDYEKRKMIYSRIMDFAKKTFIFRDIEDIKLQKNYVRKILKELETQGFLTKPNRYTYKLTPRGITLVKFPTIDITEANTVSIDPMYMKFGMWKFNDLVKKGFELVSFTIYAQGTMDGKKEIKRTWIESAILRSKKNRKVTFNAQSKFSDRSLTRLNSLTVPGEFLDHALEYYPKQYKYLRFHIRIIVIKDEFNNVVRLRALHPKKLFIVTSINGVSFKRLDIDEISKILNNLYWKSCMYSGKITFPQIICSDISEEDE